MRFSTLLALGLLIAALAAPSANPNPEADAILAKSEIVAGSTESAIEARAAVYFNVCIVTASALKYRTCASTSCAAVGQYAKGKKLNTYLTKLSPTPYVSA